MKLALGKKEIYSSSLSQTINLQKLVYIVPDFSSKTNSQFIVFYVLFKPNLSNIKGRKILFYCTTTEHTFGSAYAINKKYNPHGVAPIAWTDGSAAAEQLAPGNCPGVPGRLETFEKMK